MAIKSALKFFQEVKVEFSKVIWPKFDEFVGSTLVVLVLVCILALYLGVIDLGFTKLMKQIFKYGSSY